VHVGMGLVWSLSHRAQGPRGGGGGGGGWGGGGGGGGGAGLQIRSPEPLRTEFCDSFLGQGSV